MVVVRLNVDGEDWPESLVGFEHCGLHGVCIADAAVVNLGVRKPVPYNNIEIVLLAKIETLLTLDGSRGLDTTSEMLADDNRLQHTGMQNFRDVS